MTLIILNLVRLTLITIPIGAPTQIRFKITAAWIETM